MISNIYSKLKQFIKENLFFLILPLVVIGTLSIPLPYYVDAPGGIIDLDGKIKVKGGYKQSGSLNITYVSSYDGNVGTYLISKINKNWDLVPINDVKMPTETKKDVTIRNKILLDNAKSNAYYVAYNELDKNIDIKNANIYVLFIDENAETNLETGDIIKKIDGKDINSSDDILEYLSTKDIGDKLNVVTKNKEEKYITVGILDGKKSLKISVICNYDYNNDVIFNFTNKESGPSGGLMFALSIYNQSTKNDITKGRKIAGTGTLDINGNVGEIGGIKYKISGAINEKVDIFFLPYENYEEAKKVVKENEYNINLVPVKTFVDAINYLNR